MIQGDDEQPVRVPAGPAVLEGDLSVPPDARAVVLFVHGSGSSRLSPRNRHVARTLRQSGLGTLLIDLLTREEEGIDTPSGLRFDIALLGARLNVIIEWLHGHPATSPCRLGLFGASTGAAAALLAAADRPDEVGAVVCRGGRPDLAGVVALTRVRAPTLLIVGGWDAPVVQLNEQAFHRLAGPKALEIVPGASHLFEEPGALDHVARLAAGWFVRYLLG